MNSAAADPSSSAVTSKGLVIGLWITQVLLALAFGASGAMKLLTPIAELAAKLPWASEVPNLTRFIGASEVLGAVGLILPAATRIKPKLTGLAGVGLATVMLLAMVFHVARGEGAHIAPNIVLGGLAAFVAWGRLKKAPITPR